MMSREDIGEGRTCSVAAAVGGVHTAAGAAREPRGVRPYRSSNYSAVRRPTKKIINPYQNVHFFSSSRSNSLSSSVYSTVVTRPYNSLDDLSNLKEESHRYYRYRSYQPSYSYTQNKTDNNNSTRNHHPSDHHNQIQSTSSSSTSSCLKTTSSPSPSCRRSLSSTTTYNNSSTPSPSPGSFSSFSASTYAFHLKPNSNDDDEMHSLYPSSHAEYHSKQNRYTLYSLSSDYSVPPFTHSELIATQTYKCCDEKPAAAPAATTTNTGGGWRRSSNSSILESSELMKMMGEERRRKAAVYECSVLSPELIASSSVDSRQVISVSSVEDGDDVAATAAAGATTRVISSGVTTPHNTNLPERIRRSSVVSSCRGSVYHQQPHHYHKSQHHHYYQPSGQKRFDSVSNKTSVVVTDSSAVLVKENDETIPRVSSTPLVSGPNKSSTRCRRASIKEKTPPPPSPNILKGCSNESLASLYSSVENQVSTAVSVPSTTTTITASPQPLYYHLSSSNNERQFSSVTPPLSSWFSSYNFPLDSHEGGGGERAGEEDDVEFILMIARNLLRLYSQQRTPHFHQDPHVFISLQKLQSYILHSCTAVEDPVCIQQIREIIGALELAFMDSLQIHRQLEEQIVNERVVRRRSSFQKLDSSNLDTGLETTSFKEGGGGGGKVGVVGVLKNTYNNSEKKKLSLRHFRSNVSRAFENFSNYFRRKQTSRNSEIFNQQKHHDEISTTIINNHNNAIEYDDILESSSSSGQCSTEISSLPTTAGWIAVT